jgi:hypothetical protein
MPSIQQQGRYAVADFTGHNVLKVDMQSKAVSTLFHDDRFNQPNDICVNSHDRYIIRLNGRRYQPLAHCPMKGTMESE